MPLKSIGSTSRMVSSPFQDWALVIMFAVVTAALMSQMLILQPARTIRTSGQPTKHNLRETSNLATMVVLSIPAVVLLCSEDASAMSLSTRLWLSIVIVNSVGVIQRNGRCLPTAVRCNASTQQQGNNTSLILFQECVCVQFVLAPHVRDLYDKNLVNYIVMIMWFVFLTNLINVALE